MKKQTAFVTGVTGQDGSYMAELLLRERYKVYGLVRRSASINHANLVNCADHPDFEIVEGDLTEYGHICRLIQTIQPDEFYNFAAMSHVHYSFDNPVTTAQVDFEAVENIIYAIEHFSRNTKLYHASTSEMFAGDPDTAPQNENTPFDPQSPYGIAKLAAYKACQRARDRGIFVCSSFLFNHEAPRRGSEFVTQKIVENCVDIKLGKKEKFGLGYIESKRDWGYAPEYMRAVFAMMQSDIPEDFVIATGETYTVREFLQWTLDELDLTDDVVEVDPNMFRPNEVKVLCGDPSKAKNILGWEAKIKAKDLALIMIEAALRRQGANPANYMKNHEKAKYLSNDL